MLPPCLSPLHPTCFPSFLTLHFSTHSRIFLRCQVSEPYFRTCKKYQLHSFLFELLLTAVLILLLKALPPIPCLSDFSLCAYKNYYSKIYALLYYLQCFLSCHFLLSWIHTGIFIAIVMYTTRKVPSSRSCCSLFVLYDDTLQCPASLLLWGLSFDICPWH